jgi:hypothetical protein
LAIRSELAQQPAAPFDSEQIFSFFVGFAR